MICAPVATGWRAICADDLRQVGEGAGADRVEREVFVVTWSASIRVDSGMSLTATTTGPVVGASVAVLARRRPATSRRIPTKATIARKTPMSRTSRLDRFKLILPDEWCDRWHHSSTAQRARDYTKGLGP